MTSTNPKDALSSADDAARNPSSSYDPFSSAGGGSLPLLVKMPDGERHQVDVPANSSVRDLKHTIASMSNNLTPTTGSENHNLQWDLDFAGSILNENHTLDHYHIPDAYDHANGLLKTISDSGYGDPDKKVEALDKAYAVVQGISRGERDMERLLNAVFEQAGDTVLDSPSTQPTIASMRKTRRSRIPSLNFNQLPPIGAPVPAKNAKPGLSSAPPTPSQLIRRLSNFRPDLYDPSVVAKATAPFNPPPPALGQPQPPSSAAQPSQNATATTSVLPVANEQPHSSQQPHSAQQPHSSQQQSAPINDAEGAALQASMTGGLPTGVTSTVGQQGGSGELKRGNTWFTDVISSFGSSAMNADNSGESDDDEDVDGDSEGEGENAGNTNAHSSASNDRSEDASESTQQNGTDGPFMSAMNAANSAVRLSVKAEGGKGIEAALGSNDPKRKTSTDPDVSETTGRKDSMTGSAQTGGHSAQILDSQVVKGGGTSSRASDTPSSPAQSTTSGGKSVQPHKQVIGLEPDMPLSAPPETVHVKIPKKRGRKRKNPHLSEEQRKAQRQAQNRESAKLSRIRRKKMTIEYEKRVNTLEGENENLRDTVAALTDRLEMLQNLLTISVQKRPIPTGAMEQLATAQQAAMAAAAGRGQVAGLTGQPAMNMPGLGMNTGAVNVPSSVGLMPGVSVQDPHAASQVGRHSMSSSIPQTTDPLSNLDFNHLQ